MTCPALAKVVAQCSDLEILPALATWARETKSESVHASVRGER